MWPRITKCNCFDLYFNITHLRPFITYSHSITKFHFFVFIELEHYRRVFKRPITANIWEFCHIPKNALTSGINQK